MENLIEDKKKSIGIITFHWATNYGAVLQAYALQCFLEINGYNVTIINYRPWRYQISLFSCLCSKSLSRFREKFKNLQKENKLKLFRKEKLNLTKCYNSASVLNCKPPFFDIYISGSDQVWNIGFTTKSKLNQSINKVYFLDFVSDKSKKIAYAVSFGTTIYPKRLIVDLFYDVQDFDFISVRENSGINILDQFSYKRNRSLICDPTLLLYKTDIYRSLINTLSSSCDVFIYLLRDNKSIIKKGLIHLLQNKSLNFSTNESIEDWLSNIYNSKLVVTNSYHGVIFSILFKKNFIVILDKQNRMNDRFYTLLNNLNLVDRIIYKISDLPLVMPLDIDWAEVYDKLEEFVSFSICKILQILK